jgi:DHA2 family multidrug resistance protein
MMPVVGVLVSKLDARILITFGCTVSALALFVMAGWNLNLDYKHAVYGRMLQSLGLAFLFIPINVAAFAFVPKEKTNMGTGIINLARNIGASVGIATVTTMLERRTQFHMAQLMDHINNMNAAFRNNLSGFTTVFVSGGSSTTDATSRAYGMIYGVVQKQAAMLAFLDNFKMLGVVFFLVIPPGRRTSTLTSFVTFPRFVTLVGDTWGSKWLRKRLQQPLHNSVIRKPLSRS